MEALNVSVNEFGYVNLAYMLSIYEPDITNAKEELAEKSGQTVDEITLSDDALAELRRAVLVEELDGLVFLNPDRYNENNPDIGWETADEYLSGNVRDKLRVAKAMAADTDNPQAERFVGNVAALEKVQPEWIEASDIDVKIGTTWIEPLDYEQFIYELLNTPRRARAVRSQFYNTGIQVHLNKMSMEWFIENKSMDKHSVAATKTYGTSRMDAYSIFEDTLNLKTVDLAQQLYPDVENMDRVWNVFTEQDTDSLRKELFSLLDDPRLNIISRSDYGEEFEVALQSVMILIYGLLCFLFLFALVNLVNTLITNLLSRQQEFGVLQSVGMSGRQLSKMLTMECLCYIVVTLVIMLLFGGLIGAFLVVLITKANIVGPLVYQFPIWELLTFAAALLLILVLYSAFAVRYMRRQSLVERIKAMS